MTNSSDPDQTYFLAQLKPNSLKIAQRNLERQGFKTFAPMTPVTKRTQSRFKTTEQPVFPGYIFVALDIETGGWRAVNSTTGVTKLVSFGSTPAPVPDAVMAQLFAQYHEGIALSATDSLKPNDTVSITQGPFADFIAQIERVDPNQRVWLLIEMMGKKTRVAVSGKQIRPA